MPAFSSTRIYNQKTFNRSASERLGCQMGGLSMGMKLYFIAVLLCLFGCGGSTTGSDTQTTPAVEAEAPADGADETASTDDGGNASQSEACNEADAACDQAIDDCDDADGACDDAINECDDAQEPCEAALTLRTCDQSDADRKCADADSICADAEDVCDEKTQICTDANACD